VTVTVTAGALGCAVLIVNIIEEMKWQGLDKECV
jgi:hypothetical protein